MGGEAEEVGKLRRILKYLFGYGVSIPYVLRDADVRWRWSIEYQEWVPTGEHLPTHEANRILEAINRLRDDVDAWRWGGR